MKSQGAAWLHPLLQGGREGGLWRKPSSFYCPERLLGRDAGWIGGLAGQIPHRRGTLTVHSSVQSFVHLWSAYYVNVLFYFGFDGIAKWLRLNLGSNTNSIPSYVTLNKLLNFSVSQFLYL